MAFFNNQAHAGLALLAFAILSILGAVITFALAAIEYDGYELIDAVPAIGSLLAGFLYLGFAARVRGGKANNAITNKLNETTGISGGALNDKFSIVVEFVHVFAIATIIEGVFALVNPLVGIISIILGLIVLFLYKKITDGKESIIDKIVWIILLILFLLTIIAGVIMLFGIITIPLGIATMIIGIFMFCSLLDNDVKQKFGM